MHLVAYNLLLFSNWITFFYISDVKQVKF